MSDNGTGGHEIPLTPPAETVDDRSGASRSRRGIGAAGIALAVVGGIALLGTGATAAVASTVQVRPVEESSSSVDVTGVTALDLEVGASGMNVVFGAVDEAQLRVDGHGGHWRLERDGNELVVRSPERRFGWWFGEWFRDGERAQLVLPEQLRGIDASVDLTAGSLDLQADFAELSATVGAGQLTIDGSADRLDAEVNAGNATIDLAEVASAELDVSAGWLNAELTGTAPRDVAVSVSAGQLDLTVPDAVYDVTDDVSAGSFDKRVQTSSQSANRIDVDVSAGSVTLRPGR